MATDSYFHVTYKMSAAMSSDHNEVCNDTIKTIPLAAASREEAERLAESYRSSMGSDLYNPKVSIVEIIETPLHLR